MRFPFDPETKLPEGRFLIQEQDYRTRILPLFDFASGQPDERVAGQGTAFRIDPWGKCATAFHVFESAFYLGGATGREILVRQDRSIVALELDGSVFGICPIQSHQWRTIGGVHSIVRIEERPLDTPRIRNFTEVLAVSIPPSSPQENGTEFLHIDMSAWRPTLGETLLGVGYPNLDRDGEEDDRRPISQYMYGSYGRVIDVEPLDFGRGRPWPMARVDADWPGGMSGGPVLNKAGDVIGIISSGFDLTTSTAMIFGGWRAVHQTFPTLDRARPGWFRCYATLDANERLIAARPNRREADAIAAQRSGTFVSAVTLDPASGRFVRLEL